MELLPADLRASLPALYSQERNPDPRVHLKFFTPDSDWTWFVTGVRFVIPNKLPIGKTVDCVVTRSNGSPASEIHCVGHILRCVKKYADQSFEVVATIERSGPVPGEMESSPSAADSLRPMFKRPPDSDAGDSSFRRIPTVDADRYGPMLRLLSDEDEEMIADPALRRKMRAQRRDLFRGISTFSD